MPTVTQIPGGLEPLQQGLAQLIQALQNKQAQQQANQRLQMSITAQQDAQERSQALNLLVEGMKEPGFESTPQAEELEGRVGIPGYSKEIGRLRTQRNRALMAEMEKTIDGLGVDEQTREALRSVTVIKLLNPDTPAEVLNDLYQRVAPEAPLSALDEANLANVRARTRQIDRTLQQFNLDNPTIEDQQGVARVLGMDFFPGVDYIDIYETVKSRKDDTPSDLAVTVAMQFARQTDLFGRPVFTTEQAVSMGADVVSSLVPGAAITPTYTPQQRSRIEAASSAMTAWIGLRGEKMKDPEIRRTLANELLIRYGISLTREDINDILDRTERNLPER